MTYEPAFTQHGFRYVEITGVEDIPDVVGVVYGSDLTTTGSLETSNPMLNQLLSNISWGQRDNFVSIPTDTPARDERLGWTGDINVFAPTANYLRDTRAFLGKWMIDLRDTQQENGDFLSVAPSPPGQKQDGSTGWSDAGITVPYSLWQSYGDASVIREVYPAMKRYLSLLQSMAGENLIPCDVAPPATCPRSNYDDWLNLGDPTGKDLLGTAYFANDARMLSEMAAAIGTPPPMHRPMTSWPGRSVKSSPLGS